MTGQYRDLLDLRDISQLLKKHMSSVEFNSSGDNIVFYDVSADDIVLGYLGPRIAGVLCQSQTENGSNDVTYGPSYVDIKCHTTAFRNTIFSEGTFPMYLVKCPANCIEVVDAPVYGSFDLFDQASSICRSAIHQGIITNDGGFVSVSLESPLDEGYTGTSSNSIQSDELESYRRSPFSIRVTHPESTCPIDVISYQQDKSDHRGTAFIGVSNQPSDLSSTRTAAEGKLTVQMNTQLKLLYSTISRIHGKSSAGGFQLVKRTVDESVADAIRYIKPIRKQTQQVELGYETYEPLMSGWKQGLVQIVSKAESKLERLTKRSDLLSDRIEHSTRFTSVLHLLNPLTEAENSMSNQLGGRFDGDNWILQDASSHSADGVNVDETSDLDLVLVALPNTMSQLAVNRIVIPSGLFYDTSIQVTFGSTALHSDDAKFFIFFRYHGVDDHLHLEVSRSDKATLALSLHRIKLGNNSTLSSCAIHPKNDDVMIRVDLRDSRIGIHVDEDQDQEVMSVQDGTFRFGNVGLGSSGLASRLEVTSFKIDALECQDSPSPAEDEEEELPSYRMPVSSYFISGQPPLPPHCVVFNMSHQAIQEGIEYPVLNHKEAPQDRSWLPVNEYRGRHDVFIQRKTYDPRESILLFRRPWGTCYDGRITGDMLLRNASSGAEGGLLFGCDGTGDCLLAKLTYEHFGLFSVKVARHPNRIVGVPKTHVLNPTPMAVQELMDDPETDIYVTLELQMLEEGGSRQIKGTISYPATTQIGALSQFIFNDSTSKTGDSSFGLYGKQAKVPGKVQHSIDADVSFTRIHTIPLSKDVLI
eukprot:GHVH01006576.1.p1 GENE.GHVH01006576.1~~GHVH01006576.1.p1  ORF type:complete len:812 (-),score=113.66 GHVH01006576.1:53-2488(-)